MSPQEIEDDLTDQWRVIAGKRFMTHSRNHRQLCIREVLVKLNCFVQRYERVPIADQHQTWGNHAPQLGCTMFSQSAPGWPYVFQVLLPVHWVLVVRIAFLEVLDA